MAGLSQPERYHLVAPLPPLGGWRRMLALDRRGGPAGPVVLSFAPAAVLEDPARLAALSRDAEAGARVHHPNVVQVVGLETVEEQLVLVEPYRPGTTLRALLDGSGRLPVELAVRIGWDAAQGLAALHGVDAGDGQPLAHGALTAERIVVAEDGTSLVEGVGVGAGRSPADDVRALAGVLVEAVTGEPPQSPPVPLVSPGLPPALAAVLGRALGAAPPSGPATAAAFAEALAAVFPPASVEAVAVYLEATAPPPALSEPPAPMDAPEVSAELIAPGKGPFVEPTPADGSAAAPERSPVPDAAITFPAPVPARPGRRLSLTLPLAAVVLIGFGGGFALSRLRVRQGEAPPAAARGPSEGTQPSLAAAPAPGSPEPSSPPVAVPSEGPSQPGAPPATPGRPPGPSLSVTATPAAEVLVDGRAVGRAPVLIEVKAGEHEVRLRDRSLHIDVRRRVTVKAPATPVRFQLTRGMLEVTAPADTEVWVDGRRVGRGDQKVDLWEGSHEVEVRRGSARAHERFELTAEVTHWTYAVTSVP